MDKSKTKNRLKEFMEFKGITREKLAEKYNLSVESIRDYRNGTTKLPPKLAYDIATDFNISIDWLYGRSNFMDDSDIISAVLLALGTVFRTHTKTRLIRTGDDTYEYEGNSFLCVERNFFDFILAIQDLDFLQSTNSIVAKKSTYKKLRTDLYEGYKGYFEDLIANANFDKEKSVKFDSIKLFDLLPNVKENYTQDTN